MRYLTSRNKKTLVFITIRLLTYLSFLWLIVTTILRLRNRASWGVRKIIFMKNHKCASSTIENIIFRYAYKNNLNVVIPPSGAYLSTKALFNRSVLDPAPWKNLNFDVFSLHNRWNYKEVAALMGKGTPIFTIIRDPVEVFISFFYFFPPIQDLYGSRIEVIGDVVNLIRNASQHKEILNKRALGQFGRNQMAWDLGIDPKDFENKTTLNKKIRHLDKQFNLVMIASRMEESLILLRLLLDWPLENVQFLARNRRPHEEKRNDKITTEERNLLLKWLDADAMIYEYFSEIFNEKVAKINEQFSHLAPPGSTFVQYEAAKLKELNNKLMKRCVKGETIGVIDLLSPYQENEGTVGYVVNEEFEDCPMYAWNQDTYLNKFKNILLSQVSLN